MNDKQQLAAMGEHMAEQAGKTGQAQPLCMAKRIEDLEAQVRVMAALLREALTYVDGPNWQSLIDDRKAHMFLGRIDAALSGKLPDPTAAVTETIRTAPERIWLQVGDQEHYHSEQFPTDTSEVSWCADSVMACEVPYVRADLAGHVSGHTEQPIAMVPKGWQMVPVELTKEMDLADDPYAEGKLSHGFMWSDMLAAAPKSDATK